MNNSQFSAIFYGYYYRVLEIANRALHQAKLRSIEVLQKENPSYKELAENLYQIHDKLSKIAPALGLDYDASKLEDYVNLVNDMAIAIDAGDSDTLNSTVAILDKKPFL